MKLTRLTTLTPRVVLLGLPLCLAACRDAQVASYRIPKENDTPPLRTAPGAAEAGMAGGTGGLAVASLEAGSLEWVAPPSWTPKPSTSMRRGSYRVGTEAGPNADLAITAFPGDVGGDLANVNRWLGQLARPPIEGPALASVLHPLAGTVVPMQVVDLAGGTPEAPLRMLGAIVPRDGVTWFFKLTGPDALVAGEKVAFIEFLKTVKVSTAPASAASASLPAAGPATPSANDPLPAGHPPMTDALPAGHPPTGATAALPTGHPPAAASAAAPAPADMSGSPVVAASGPGLKWKAPAHWQQKATSAMRKGTFAIPGKEGGPGAELAITAFPGDVGGDLANFNRWRGQLMLAPASQDDFNDAARRFKVNGLSVTVVEITGGGAGSPTRLLGAMVPYDGATWFFKLTGPNQLIVAEKPAFLDFIKSLSAP